MKRRVLAAAVVAYLLGSVMFADVVARAAGVDIRSAGTGNPGAWNARRVLGRRRGHLVAAGDVAKGAVACLAGRVLAGSAGSHVAGVSVVAGHCYPVWSGFRGGKGVATSVGQCLVTFPAFVPLDFLIARGVSRIPGLPRPALATVAAGSISWVAAGFLWWRRRLPNLWGPPPTGMLPAANAASVAVIASRVALSLARRQPDELALDR